VYPVAVRFKHLAESEAKPQQTATSQNSAAVQDGLHVATRQRTI
jgi:hypothetical protein